MPDPSTLDLNVYLTPISDDQPSGESLRYEEEYAAIERAREEELEVDSTDRWRKRNPKKADWDAVISIGLKALKEKTKDLEIAAWVAEALFRRRGLIGLRDGLRLLRSIQDTFWESAHPSKEDLELREGVYEFLDFEKCLPFLVRSVPLVSVFGLPPYSFLKYKESREIKNTLLKNPEREDVLKSEGKLFPDDFDQAVLATDRSFYVSTIALLGECLEATEELNHSIKAEEHFGSKGPSLTRTTAALEEVLKLVRQFLADKPGHDPEPVEDQDEPEAPWESEESSPEDAPPAWDSTSPPESNRRQVNHSRLSTKPVAGTIASPDDARSWIAEAARHLREADATDPVSYLVLRSLRMGELYRATGPIEPSMLRPPTSEDRQALRRLDNEGSWAELLEEAERILARPEATGWLDARRLALKALGELGHEAAAKAARAVLAAELRDYPEWPAAELDDGTPCAGVETRRWIEENFPREGTHTPDLYAPQPSTFDEQPPRPSDRDAEGPQDPWDLARELYESGRAPEAVALLGRAAREASTGRERFLRTFQQAELCLMMGRPGVATPLLEGLARQIDEFRLDRWEDPGLCARVVAALYRCVRGKDEARARTIYDRLCQLDIGQALSLGDSTDT